MLFPKFENVDFVYLGGVLLVLVALWFLRSKLPVINHDSFSVSDDNYYYVEVEFFHIQQREGVHELAYEKYNRSE